MNVKPFEILLVEDSRGDVELVKAGLRRGRIHHDLKVACDGVEAMDYLLQRGKHEDALRPDLVLLDINLPRKNGHEVLKEIRGTPALCALPVVVLTTSDHDHDILSAYEHHANAYVRKPLGGAAFIEAVQGIEDFWLALAQLPKDLKDSA